MEDKLFNLEEDNSQLEADLKKSKQDVFRLQVAREKLSTFTEEQLKELRELQGKEEQFHKIDEMMGKMMLILLADFGIKLSTENRSYVKSKTLRSSPEAKSFEEPPKIENEKKIKEDIYINESDFQLDQEDMVFINDSPESFDRSIDKLKKEARRFQTFRNLLKGNIKNMLPNPGVFKILFKNKQFKGKKQPAPETLVQFYTTKNSGEYRRGVKTKQKVDYHLESLKKKNSKGLPLYLLNFNTRSKKTSSLIHIKGEFTASHSSSHRNDGRGPCQFLVLNQEDGPLQVYLTNIRFKGKQTIFGKILNTKNKKYPTVGYFILNQEK